MSDHRRSRLSAILVILASLFATRAWATSVLFTDLGPGESFDTGTVYVVGTNPNSPSTGQEEVAASFNPILSEMLTEIDVPIANHRTPDQMTFYLETGDTQPTTVLEQWSVTGLSPTVSVIVPLVSSGGIQLTTGTRYWVVAAADDPMNTDDNWANNNEGVHGAYIENLANPSWTFVNTPSPAFQVLGEVPEPSTILGTGIALILLARWRCRRNNVKQSPESRI